MSKVEKAVLDLAKVSDLNAVVSECSLKSENIENNLLLDMPVVVKDNISTKGIKTTGSSKFLESYVPVFDATVVEKLKNSGATIIAKTSLDELAMGGFGLTSATGPVLNPLDNTRVAGGSSAGSAALVAANVVEVAIGTDTGDSCRIPASYCGIVGFKPTYGRISRYGVLPFANSLDHVGIFSNNVKNAAVTLEAIAGYDSQDMTSSKNPVDKYSDYKDVDLGSKKIGVIDNVVEAVSNKEIVKAFNSLVNKLNEHLDTVEHIVFNRQLFKAQNTLYKIISNAEAVSSHSNLNGLAFGERREGLNLEEIMINSRSKGFGSQVKARYLIGGYSLDINNIETTFNQAKKVRRLLVDDINESLEDVDFLMAPAAARIAPKLDEVNNVDIYSDEHLIANNYMVMDNYTGNPGIVVPMTKVDGMPVGVYISSKAFNEKDLLAIASLIEEIVGEI